MSTTTSNLQVHHFVFTDKTNLFNSIIHVNSNTISENNLLSVDASTTTRS